MAATIASPLDRAQNNNLWTPTTLSRSAGLLRKCTPSPTAHIIYHTMAVMKQFGQILVQQLQLLLQQPLLPDELLYLRMMLSAECCPGAWDMHRGTGPCTSLPKEGRALRASTRMVSCIRLNLAQWLWKRGGGAVELRANVNRERCSVGAVV